MRRGWCCRTAGCRSTSERRDDGADRILPAEEEERTPVRAVVADALPRGDASIVPADSISVRALLAVVAIMTFLASLTLGAVVLVRSAAGEWQSAVAREITIQIRASDQVEADVRNAVALASSTPGISSARAFSKEESASLLEPWLGKGLAIDELPVPRMIVIRTMPGETPDLEALRQQLAAQVPNATLRRSSRLDRPHALGGAARGAARAWPSSLWCSPPPCCR